MAPAWPSWRRFARTRHRPRLAGRLTGRGVAVRLELGPLPAAQVHAMAPACLGTSPPAEVLELVDTAEGLPLVVEDLLASAVHTGAQRQDATGWTVAGPLRPGRSRRFADTVHDRTSMLTAQARQVLRAAAVLGRTFDWRPLVGTVGRLRAVRVAGTRGRPGRRGGGVRRCVVGRCLVAAFELCPALGHQPQRRFHVCYETGTGFTVVDVWESEEAFAAFGEVLGPVLQEVGLSPVPQVYRTYETVDASGTRRD